MRPSDLKEARPRLSPAEAGRLAREVFGVGGLGVQDSARELDSDRDRNFLLEAGDGPRAVLKVARHGEDRALLELENEMMTRAAEAGLPTPRPLAPPTTVTAADGREHLARVITWCEGRPLAEVRPRSFALLRELGTTMAKLDRVLAEIDAPEAAERELHWDLRRAPEIAREGREAVADPERRALLDRWLERLQSPSAILGRRGELPRQLIHGDVNDHNVLVTEGAGGPRISGLIDFGDALVGPRVADPAIAVAYALLDARAPLAGAAAFVAGYQASHPLERREVACVFELAALRLVQSVSNSALRAAVEPDDAYLTVSEEPAWRALAAWIEIPQELAGAHLLAAAGMEEEIPASSDLLPGSLQHLVELPAEIEPLDLSFTSPHADEAEGRIAACRGRVAVERFGEVSPHAATSEPGEDRDEPRARRLGVTLHLDPRTEVHAPWDATVKAVGARRLLREAGRATLLLEGVEGGPRRGRVARGERLGRTTGRLHVQAVGSDLGLGLDLPTRARADDPVWGHLALDPVAALGLPASCSAPPVATPREVHRGRALSLSYDAPLVIVRGRGTTLFDAAGRAYLDAVNNVPHVGHCHPRVVAALREQAAVLNTNTRYLHPLRERYLERLAALFADPLEVVYLVNSGSEANELALRLVEQATGGTDWIVVEAGYHGNTRRLVERSHYKFAGPGGFDPPETVHVVPLPDTYRGRYRGEDAGARYAAHVAEACERIEAAGRRPAGFLAEPLIGCGGQVVPPDGWLARCYEHVRAAGGLCVADEVQVGFGRVGTHWWACEEQGVEPDVVTLGKPIGNGHPLGAVVTASTIAAALDDGMEWFNTFGGNPVSCAVGLAVLDVLEEEDLLANARNVGSRLLRGLRELQGRHRWIGEARGRGLYLGVELVRDRVTREPAGPEAARVAERLKDRGVLVGTDGPDRNVLKIKPPLVFSTAEADRLVEALDAVLSESWVTPRASP